LNLLYISSIGQIVNNTQIDKLAEKNKIDKEIKKIDSLIALHPERSLFYINKAELFIMQEDIFNFLLVLEDGIKINPDSANLRDVRGNIFLHYGFFEKALEDYNVAFNNESNDSLRYNYLLNRGSCKYNIRDFEGALSDYNEAIKMDSSRLYIFNNIALVYEELNKPEESIKYLKKIIEKDSLFAPGYNNIGLHYQKQDQHKKAVEYFNKTIVLAPDMPYAFSNRSLSLLKLNKVKPALKDNEYSLQLDPINSYAYKIRALIKIKKGEINDACEDLNTALYYGYTAQYGNEVKELVLEHCK